MQDADLLRQFVADRSQDAFRALVERHHRMVYNTCRRGLGGEHAAAEDATQAVFILLAQRARRIRNGNALGWWLFRAATYVVAHVKRTEARRRRREREAAEMVELSRPSQFELTQWTGVEDTVNEAIAGLRRRYQQAFVLHVLEGKTHREVGAALGCSEDAARMRIKRAVRKVRARLGRAGIAVSAAALTGYLTEQTAHAEAADLVASCQAAGLASVMGGLTASSVPAALAKGASRMMMWAKIKVVTIVVGAAAVSAGATMGVVAARNARGAGRAYAIETGDGLSLRLSADGRVAGIVVDGAGLAAPAGDLGGFVVRDVAAERARVGSAENLLPNGSFESGRAGKTLPDGWQARNEGGQWTWDATTGHSGRRAMKATVPQAEPPLSSGSLSLAKGVPVKSHQQYRLSFWAKKEGADGGPRAAMYVRQLDADGKVSAAQRAVGTKGGTGKWREYRCDFRVAPQTASIEVSANVFKSHGTAWFDDVRLVLIEEPGPRPALPLSVKRSRAGCEGVSVSRETGLRLSAVHRAQGGRIRVDVEVEDLRRTDRRIVVSYRIPLEAAGWTWWDNICHKRRVSEPALYRRTEPIEMGDGQCSIFPFNSLADKRVGLTLGVPLDQGCRVWNVGYDNAKKQFVINFYLGLSQVTRKFPGKATCSFILYRHDPVWGMRAAARRFYDFYPQHFVKRIPYEAHLNYSRIEALDSETGALMSGWRTKRVVAQDGSDFGESIPCFIQEHGAYTTAKWRGRKSEPTDDEVRAFLKRIGNQRALDQITHNPRGRIIYHKKTDKGRYAPKEGGWMFEFRVNEDPEICDAVPKRVEKAWTAWRKKNPDLPPFHYKLTSDTIQGYAQTGGNPTHTNHGADYRREHLPYTDVPLCFDKATLALGRVNMLYDLLTTFYWPDSEKKKYLVTGNAGMWNPFCRPYLDCGMIEGEPWPARSDPELSGIGVRSMCYQKLWRFWRVNYWGQKGDYNPEAVRLHFHRGMHWAIYPVGTWPLRKTTDDYRHFFRRYEPVIEIISGSGWEPVTHARSSDTDVFVERYGYFERGTLHLTVRNTTREERAARITVDADALGVTMDETLRGWEYVWQRPMPFERGEDTVTFAVRIPAQETRVVHVADARGRRLMALEQMRRGIDRIERQYWEQTRGSKDLPAARAALAGLRTALESGPSSPALLGRALDSIYPILDRLRLSLAVSGTINRDKVFYRVYDEFAPAPSELLGLQVLPPNNWPAVRKGRAIELETTVRNVGSDTVSGMRLALESPFPDAELRVLNAPASLSAGAEGKIRVRLAFAAETPRNVAPVLFRVTARRGEAECTVCRVLDVRLLDQNADLTLLPQMLNTCAEAQKLTLLVANPYAEPLDAVAAVTLPAGWQVAPSRQPIRVPATGDRKVGFWVTAPADVADGRIDVAAVLTRGGAQVEQKQLRVSVFGNRRRVTVPRLGKGPDIDGVL